MNTKANHGHGLCYQLYDSKIHVRLTMQQRRNSTIDLQQVQEETKQTQYC
jgi:hypothetical protein